ncbi:MAG: molybdopterin-dependent oxidoreductase, partial [Pseudonocardia sp.]|nr:molybdopterin-dependent oxidoreductase [Pseudonocardia sp.]
MTATADPTTLELGKSRTRKEDARLITGRTKFTDSINLPGMLHLHVVRSPLAHATITGIDAEAARSSPGVFGVYTAADLGVEAVGLPCAWPITPDMKAPQRPLLANTTVHFAGEGVAIVVARTAAEARDAADLVEVDYEPLEPVLDMEDALKEGATLVHPDLGTNENATWVFDSGAAGTGSSIDDAISAAEADPDSVVVKRRFIQQRLIPAFMEPRACVVDPTGEQLTLWSSTQVPHILRTMTTVTLGVPESKLRVIAPDVGGGFGGKLQVTPEEMLCVVLAQKLGKPVKWNETRSESLLAAHHGRDQIQDITITAKRDGT